MKTTIHIADSLLERAKRLAARRRTTLGQVVEDALRAELRREAKPRRALGLATHTFRGRGLQPGLSWDDFGKLRDVGLRRSRRLIVVDTNIPRLTSRRAARARRPDNGALHTARGVGAVDRGSRLHALPRTHDA